MLRLMEADLTVSDIAKPYKMSLPAVSKHLKVLEKSDLIKRERFGREFKFKVNPGPLRRAEAYIKFYKKFWNEAFDRLEKHLESPPLPRLRRDKEGGEK